MKKLIIAALCLLPLSAFAATVNVDVTPTFSAAAGQVDGYRAYKGCDQAAQTASTLIGPASSGTVFSFQHDTTQPNPVVCIRAYNSAGEGGFNAVTLAINLSPPGATTTTYTCTLNPVSGGTCVAN